MDENFESKSLEIPFLSQSFFFAVTGFPIELVAFFQSISTANFPIL